MPLDSRTRTIRITIFSQYLVVHAHEPVSFFAGKYDSLRDSTTGFGENFVVAETSLFRERS